MICGVCGETMTQVKGEWVCFECLEREAELLRARIIACGCGDAYWEEAKDG